ncbi:MAG TPA: ATP-binding cassette domain-containing protein [Rhodocyclaceae bacterium]|nr:ATP-binding cassette domain-containing protein [Rhodocyclaceae bacterium]
MIQFRDLTYSRAGSPLVRGASLQIHPGWRVGVVGANGCGKSSLFALLRDELHADTGEAARPAGWRIGHLAQDTPALPVPALEHALDGDRELRALEADLVRAETAGDGHQIALVHGRLQDVGGYAAPARAAEILAGLGFAAADLLRPVAEFSGGWRVRLNLAQALMSRADLLLLDEPTNHLDLDAVLWLENWLASYPGTLLVISHDRDFLDGVTTHILNFEGDSLRLYTGNFSAFETTRGERLAAQQAMHEKQEREIAHLRQFVDRFRAKATKARQAQSRLKALARMETIAAAHVDAPFHFAFEEPAAMSDPLLQAEGVSTGYGVAPILREVALTLRPGSRIGLLGRNGAGKSTLVKLLAGELAPLSGRLTAGRHLSIGYFAQHQLEQLRPDESPLWHLVRQEPQTREQELRDYLGGFDFRGAQADAPCRHFSGGEKARLALALLIRRRPNLLLLDEPTNHLDLEMREALTLALQETEAAVVLVSHDRHLLRTTVDELWRVHDGQVEPFAGDLEDYAAWLARQRAEARPADPGKTARREARAAESASRQALLQRRRPLQKEAERLEKRLAEWQGEKAGIEERLADPASYALPDRTTLETLLKRQAELATAIAEAEERWLEVQDELEAMG